MGIRAKNIQYSFEALSDALEGVVYNLEPIGNKSILTVKVGETSYQTVINNDMKMELDSRIYLRPDMENALFFDGDTGRFVVRHNQAGLLQGR